MAISLLQSKKILGKTSYQFSDSDLEHLMGQMYGLAEIITEIVYQGGSKQTTKGLDFGFGKEDYENRR